MQWLPPAAAPPSQRGLSPMYIKWCEITKKNCRGCFAYWYLFSSGGQPLNFKLRLTGTTWIFFFFRGVSGWGLTKESICLSLYECVCVLYFMHWVCLFFVFGFFFCISVLRTPQKKQGCSSQEGVHHGAAITATYADGKDSAQTEGGYFV